MENSLSKQKNDLLRSIMHNPKLSKTMKDAIAAPIGSTKRVQAKSMLSIMQKLKQPDGQGGPSLTSGTYDIHPGGNITNPVTGTDYSNMVVFPAAPSFKAAPLPPRVKGLPERGMGLIGKAGETIGTGLVRGAAVVGTGLAGGAQYLGQNVPRAISDVMIGYDPVSRMIGGSPYTKYGETWGAKKSAGFAQPWIDTPNVPKDVQSTQTLKTLATKSGLDYAKSRGWPTQYPDSTISTEQLPDRQFLTEQLPTDDLSQISGTGATIDTIPQTNTINDWQQAAFSGAISPQQYAQDIMDKRYGGSINNYLSDIDEKVRKSLGLGEQEKMLSNHEAMKDTLIPSMTRYIQGKDKHLKFINQLIENTEKSILTRDMSDPNEARQYNEYINTLYILKGRQEQRYGNYLNAEITNYNADTKRLQSNVNNTYKRYSEIMNRTTTIELSEYNNLYSQMVDSYNYLVEAPLRQKNFEALQLQNATSQMNLANMLVNQGITSDPDHFKKVKKYSNQITDKDGNLSLDALGANGLIGFFKEIVSEGEEEGSTEAAIRAINKAIATRLTNSQGVAQIQEIKNLLQDLSSVEGGAQLASMIMPTFNQKSAQLISNYVLNNLGTIKDATKDLVKGPWFGEPGITNKTEWMGNYSNLDTWFLDNLYDFVGANIGSSTYAEKPTQFVSDWFAGNNDQIIAQIIKNLLNK